MAAAPRPFIVLIRAIGGKTHRAMPLKDLCRDAEADGFDEVTNYLSTGNLILRATGTSRSVARRIEALIARYGLDNRAFARLPDEIHDALAADPFPEASRERPSQMTVTFFDDPPDEVAVATLAARGGPERITAGGRELYIDFAEGIGRSKLTPAIIERTLGQPGTTRNWNTLGGILARV